MSTNERFDDAVRRKMSEREHPFTEAHWKGMERMLDDQRAPKRIGWYFAGAAAVAIVASYFLLADEPVAMEHSSDPLRDTLTEVRTGKPAPTVTDTHVAESANVQEPADVLAATKSEPTGPSEPGAVAHVSTPALRKASPGAARVVSKPHAHVDRTGSSSEHAEPATRVDHTEPNAGRVDEQAVTAAMTGRTAPAVLPDAEGNAHADDPVVPSNVVPIDEPVVTSDRTNIPRQEDPTSTGSVEPAMTGNVTTVEPSTPITADSVVEPALVVQDTAVAAPPVLFVRSEPLWTLELSALGGIMRSTSTYAGLATDDWQAGTTSQNAPTYGVDLLYTSKHFGFGVGVMHTTYKERLDASAITREDEELTTSYMLQPYYITVPVIFDTIYQNGMVFYETMLVDTFVNQLISDVDTTYVTTTLRDARAVENSVSYMETSLLFDAHTAKGRWTFGTRFGPVLGFLSTRSGALPREDGQGYEAFDDATFKRTILGYHARAYVRYGFTPHWSVGIEPGVRGSFGNALEGDLLRRRNQGLGVWLSATYRF